MGRSVVFRIRFFAISEFDFYNYSVTTNKEKIMKIEWIDGSGIKTAIDNKEIVISANREGLLSLAKQLTALADGVPGDHIHYDAYNSLEEGSAEMTIELTKLL